MKYIRWPASRPSRAIAIQRRNPSLTSIAVPSAIVTDTLRTHADAVPT